MFLPLKEGGVDSSWLKYGIKNSSNSTMQMEKPDWRYCSHLDPCKMFSMLKSKDMIKVLKKLHTQKNTRFSNIQVLGSLGFVACLVLIHIS